MIAVILGSRQQQIVLSEIQLLMQASWVSLAIGLQEESQDAQDEHEEANPDQAHA